MKMNDREIHVQIKHLSFSYPGNRIFRGITAAVKQESFTSLVGPNGSGKTTLLRLLTRWLTPASGMITIKDRELSSISQKELGRMVAFVKQDLAVGLNFTVFEIVLMGRYPYLKRFGFVSEHDRRIAAEALERTNTTHLRQRIFGGLSSGEAQMVVLARALAQQPELLLLDEPISHLDLKHQVQILRLLKELQREKKITIIAALHDLNSAAQCSDNVILLADGTIFAQGTARRVLSVENIRDVYGIKVEMAAHPVSGLPFILPVVFT
jgi:iron complex transport system ATP-binding protein